MAGRKKSARRRSRESTERGSSSRKRVSEASPEPGSVSADEGADAPHDEEADLTPEVPAVEPSPEEMFAVVGVGGSAGSLAPLQDLLLHLPSDCGMAFVVVSHGDPSGPSLLPEILARCTRMRVREAAQGDVLEPNHVYVNHPGRKLEVVEGRLAVGPAQTRHPAFTIDSLFRSLARDQRHRAIGVVLSGNGTDGTLGLEEIRANGGVTLVQDPHTAELDGMPLSATVSGGADFVLATSEMPERLLAHARTLSRPPGTSGSREMGERDEGRDLDRILARVTALSGHDFSAYKRATLHRRIERRMHLHEITRLADYVRRVEEDDQEVEALWRDWLIGVTGFFRDADAFEALVREGIAPLLANKADGASFRIWVPGCATGEEAYSIAMLALETLQALRKRIDLKIFATDLDARAIDLARAGRYPEGVLAEVGADRLQRFFVLDDRSYRVRTEARDQIVFSTQNVLHDPPFTRMDLISCRNLLIYLTPDAQRRLIPLFHYSLNPEGLLFLGSSESITGFEHLFSPVTRRWKIFRRRETVAPVWLAPEWTGGRSLGNPGEGGPQVVRATSAPLELGDVLLKQLADRYAPPCVVVDERGQIEQVHGRTGAYLEPAEGRATLLEMAREGLRAPLASLLRQVTRNETAAASKNARVRTNGGHQPVMITARRIGDGRLPQPLFLISFERQASDASPPARSRRSAGRQNVAELEEELRITRQDLQTTIEELQAANEELASANEELQSVNEELQTSKEETQSLNEELQTVNAELRSKVEGLEGVADDLANLMNSTEIAIVFLDEEMQVKRFTPEARKLFRLIDSDIGRPLADLSTTIQDRDVLEDAEDVLRTLIPSEVEVRTETGAWYSMRARPYRTSRNAIDGLVLVFSEVTEMKNARQLAESARTFADSIVDSVQEPLIVLDHHLCVVRANRSFYAAFRADPGSTHGRPLELLSTLAGLRARLEAALERGEPFDDFRGVLTLPNAQACAVLVNGRRLVADAGEDPQVLVAIHDVGARSSSEREEPGP